ncbi:hypothetical protein V5O48_000158 [Marasmius crinis-equi]|uniref:Uncharacterized protein n=1 Tax=Marasmius crinis-equi TaxID=585013 RepID=A0ABR3G2V4_9AGAR
MRLALSEGDVVFITNNHLPNKTGWLFGIRLTADNSLAEVGLVHHSDIVRVPTDEMSQWPAILDRPIPSSVSSVLFLGGKTGKIHFGIPARIAFRRTGSTSICLGAQSRMTGEKGRYLDVDVGETVLLVGYANENYYAIKASAEAHERVWSGLVYHDDVVLLRPTSADEDPELVDVQDIRQEPPPFDSCDIDELDVEGHSVPDAGTEARELQKAVEVDGWIEEEQWRKTSKRLSTFNLRIMKWRSQVYTSSCSRRLTLVN